LGHSVNLTHLPPDDYADILRNEIMPSAPPGSTQVSLHDGSITVANEQALQVALIKYARDNGVTDISKLSVLGFENSFHGNSVITLSASDRNANI
jgi:acetylornithine/succinyldiaminopimelate/putrescine aminotransferase